MWKPEHRRAAERRGLRYPSDLTDAEWALVEPMIPPAKRGGRRREGNLGRNSSALRFVGAIRRPDVTRRNHTQACERRSREALVRAGAGFHDDRCTGEAGAAGR